ncbi:MAG: hypothetical protein IPL39_06155 [Opitutaceae bacterium]|nr:hypothetical protein [Opitutaceae bacterium]
MQRRRAAAAGTVAGAVQFAELPWRGAAASALEVTLPDGVTIRGRVAAEVAVLVRLLRGQ